ncbi:hypothetical protein NPIL_73801, partial [Nephila pilipes]
IFHNVYKYANATTRERFNGDRSDEHMDVKQHFRSLDISITRDMSYPEKCTAA